MKSNSILAFRLPIWVQICFVLALLLPVHHAYPALAATESHNERGLQRSARTDEVDRLFRSFIDEKSPGAAVIVLQRGRVLYRAAYGLADLKRNTPLTTESIFHIGSVGKQFTALGIMMLAEAGKLDYEDSIQSYLPELPAWSKPITIRHLLHHTSGIPDYDDTLSERLFEASDRPDNSDLLKAISRYRKMPTQPGKAFEYSNAGYDLLGLIIERVSGQPFPQFVESRFFAPLGMSHTFSQPNRQRMKDPLIAHSYVKGDSAPEAYDADPMDDLVGSGSIYSTLDDMARYDRALHSGKLVKLTSLKEAFTSAKTNDGAKTDYGFAFEIERWQNRPYVAHSGAWLGFTSDYVHFLKEDLAVIVLFNRDYDLPEEPRIGVQVAKIFLK